MTNISLIIDLYVSNIKSTDPRTMMQGGEGFLFILGKTPIKTTYKKTLYQLPENERKVILPPGPSQIFATTSYRPCHFLRIEIDEIAPVSFMSVEIAN